MNTASRTILFLFFNLSVGAVVQVPATLPPVRVLDNFRSSVRSVAFSPDSRLIAVGGDARTLTIWEVDSGKVRTAFESPGDKAFSYISIAFLSDGQKIATLTDEGAIQLRSLKDKPDSVEVGMSDSRSANVATSPDGKFLAFSSDRQVSLCVLELDKVRQPYGRMTALITRLAYSTDGKFVAGGTLEGTLAVWECASGQKQEQLSGSKTAVNFLGFSRDDRYLISHQGDRVVTVWERATGKSLRQFKADLVAISANGNYLLSFDDDRFQISDIQSGEKVGEVVVKPTLALSMAVSPDGKWLALGTDAGQVRLWDISSWTPPRNR